MHTHEMYATCKIIKKINTVYTDIKVAVVVVVASVSLGQEKGRKLQKECIIYDNKCPVSIKKRRNKMWELHFTSLHCTIQQMLHELHVLSVLSIYLDCVRVCVCTIVVVLYVCCKIMWQLIYNKFPFCDKKKKKQKKKNNLLSFKIYRGFKRYIQFNKTVGNACFYTIKVG